MNPCSVTHMLRSIVTRSFLLICFGILGASGSAQHQLDIGLFPSATPNVLELRVRSAQTFQFVVSEITFTIRWETASGATLGAINLASCPSQTIPLTASGDGEVNVGGFRYKTFSGFGSIQLQQCGTQSGYNWPAGQEVVIATFPVSNVTGCANFNIVNDSYTGANNKDYYASFGGSPVTGTIFSSPAQICAGAYVDVAAKAFLDGAYNSGTGLMTENLRSMGLIPLAHPYGSAPFNHTGTETRAAGVTSVTGSNAIVDWVLLELRNASNSSSIVARRAALIQRDGDIVDVDGVSPVRFAGMAATNYFIAVRHRNHLGIMTATTRSLSQTSTSVNFTLAATATFGTNARRTVGSVMTMWGGNANGNAIANYNGLNNDRQAIVTLLGSTTILTPQSGYLQQDVTMNGLVNYNGLNNDRQYLVSVLGSTTILSPRPQQLP